MSKVIRLSDVNIKLLEDYKNYLVEYYSRFTSDKTFIEFTTNLDYNDLIKSALKNVNKEIPFP